MYRGNGSERGLSNVALSVLMSCRRVGERGRRRDSVVVVVVVVVVLGDAIVELLACCLEVDIVTLL